tara:strand:- start:131 stop:430 length:300 start_codon:yes stop_codon:yes gene_type:complete
MEILNKVIGENRLKRYIIRIENMYDNLPDKLSKLQWHSEVQTMYCNKGCGFSRVVVNGQEMRWVEEAQTHIQVSNSKRLVEVHSDHCNGILWTGKVKNL